MLPRARLVGSSRVTPLTLVAFVMFAAAACGGNSADAPPQAPPPTDVQTVTLAPTPVPRASEFVATIRSLQSATIQPQVEGIVRQILVNAGDRVRAGQPLLQIDPDRAAGDGHHDRVAARRARGRPRARQAAAERACRRCSPPAPSAGPSSNRRKPTHKTAQAQLDAVQSQIRESQVAAALLPRDRADRRHRRRHRRSAWATASRRRRRSPRSIRPKVSRPTSTCRSSGRRACDRACRSSCSTPPARSSSPTPITFIAPRADDATQSVLVKAALRQTPPGCACMQYVRARIVWSNEPALAVPVVAVNRIAGQYFVFVAETGDQGIGRAAEAGDARRRRRRRLRRPQRPQRRRARHRLQRAEDRRRRAGQAELTPMFVDTFIRRPILATVCSLVIVLAGRAGHSADADRAVPGRRAADGRRSPPSTPAPTPRPSRPPSPRRSNRRSTASRACSTCPRRAPTAASAQITVTFDVTRNPDLAAVDVQNRVNQALGRLPAEVRQLGVTVQKVGRNFVSAAASIRPTASTTRCSCRITSTSTSRTRSSACPASPTCRSSASASTRCALWLDPVAAGGAPAHRRRRRQRAARAERQRRRRQHRRLAGAAPARPTR